MDPHIHIIAFNIPYPADYGGVIDIFYKIRALHNAGMKIYLHCFEYGRERQRILEDYCEKVYYYRRRTGFSSHLRALPYIIYSRKSSRLLQNLTKDPYPILFEGLHTTYYITRKELKERIKVVRAHNIEHRYYFKLFMAERMLARKFFFFTEAIKLYFAQNRMKFADSIAAISSIELKYFQNKFNHSFLLNAFHSNDKIDILTGKGEYVLYHGNLSVPENVNAVNFLIEKVMKKIDYPFIIAGKNPDKVLFHKIKKHKNIQIISSPNRDEMKKLIKNAHANIIISFQDTGIKLKLIESLFIGRHCIVNSIISAESGLEELCEIANSPAEMIIQIKKILDVEFDKKRIEIRKRFLKSYLNKSNAELLIQQLKTLS